MKLRFNIITLVAVLLCSIAAQAQERNANRMVFHKGSNILKTYSVDEVDSICFDYVENKEVGIKVKNIDNYAVTVAFTKPDNCKYYLVSAIPANSKEDLTKYVLSNYKAKLTEDKEYTFEGLKSGIEYYIMALPVDKYGLSTILSKKKVTTLSSDYNEQESQFFDVDYWGDAYLNGYQNFVIRMGDCPHNGVYPQGNGRIFNFSIYNKKADGTTAPMPQLGTYSYYTGDTPIDMCMEHTESILLVYSDFKGEKEYTDKTVKYKDATLTINKNADGTYTVKALIEQEDGELIALNYTGKCTYRDRSFKGYTGPNVDKDLEFECDWLIPYDLDGTCFEIMDGGDPSADGASWYKRNRITIFLADDNGTLLPRTGTFLVTKDGANGTVRAGSWKNFGGGVSGSDGTRYEYREGLEGMSTFGFISGGSVTIRKNNATGDYIIATDFVTDKGCKINATYVGPFKSNKAASATKKRVARVAPAAK